MPAAPAPPAPKVDLPPGVLQPKAQPLIDAAMKSGEAMANQVEVCSECEKCPQCAQLHWEQIQVGEASSYLGAQTEKFWKDLQKSFQDGAEAYDRAIRRPAWDRWIGASFWYQSASALVNSMAADNPWVFSGVGLDPSKISFTPHPGWIEVPLGTGTRCWVADESLIGLAHQAASAAATYEAYMAAVADLNAACNELSNAEAAYKVAEATYDAKMQQLRDWFDAEGSKFVDTLNDLRARSRRLDAALAACRTKCQQDVAKESANILVAVLSGLGVVGVTLGSLLVAIGQPFDSGSNTAIASSASTAASTTAAPTSSSSASTSSTSTVAAVEVPDIAPDDVMIDMFMRGMHGVTAFPGVDFAPFLGEGEQTKFALTPAEPLFRTSFYSETLDELGMFPGVLGPPINVTGTAVTSLDFVTPRADPVNDIFNRYGTTGETLWAPFVPSGTLPGMTAFTLQMDGNVADPSFCDGREFQFAFNIFDPAYGEPFAALPQYPADYYDGGNYFAWFGMRDCQLGGGFSQGSTLTPTDVTGGAFLSTDGTGSTLTFFLPTPPSGPDASVYMILFEYPGTTFQPDNTRFQSVPDILGPATSLSTAIVTSDCNFTLAPQSPPTTATSATTPATTATPPSVTSGGGGTPSGGSGTDGTGTGTATGTGTGAGTGTAVAADPDETRPGVVTGGVASAALGGTALAAASGVQRRRRTTPARPGSSTPAGSAPPPGGTDAAPPPGSPSAPTGPTGPETTLPGAKELADTQARRAEAERAANEQAVTNARTEMQEAERAYHSAVASRAAREGAEANEGWFEELTDWYSNRNKTEAALLQRAFETEERALRAYRAAVSRYVTARLLLTASQERANELSRIASEVNENAVGASNFESIERVITLPESNRERISTLANARARMRTARIFHEAIALATTRINPGSGTESTLVKQLDYLASGIKDTRRQREYQYNESQAHYDTREWFRDTERDLRVETAVTLAEQGTVLDPRDGTVLRGEALRARFAADRIQWMADFLDQASWRRNDPRTARASELRRHLKEAYATLDYLGHGTVPMREFFSAAALTIRRRQDEVNTWFIKDYLGLPTQSTGTWWDTIKVGWNVKLGTSGRVAGFGEQNIDVVRQRIYTMNLQADHAVDALKTAAETPDPDDLPENVRDLLETYGYIEVREDGTSVYVIPTADSLAQRVTSIDRPGASWLDVVSVQNAGEILVSVALPELASARVAAIATRLGVSVRAVRAATILTDQVVGLATDVAFNYAHSEPGKFNLASSALESLAMSWVGTLSRMGSDLVVGAVGNRTLGRLITDDATRKQVIGTISELMGVPVDTVQQIAFNAAKGQTVTSDDVLAALLGSAMNAAGARVGKRGAESIEHALSLLPRDLRERSIVLAPNDGLRHAIETDARLNERAERRFDSVVGDGALDRGTGSRIFEALRLGDLTWSELQRVYTIRGSEMDTVMDQVRLDRDRFVRSVVSAARVLATDMINRHYDTETAAATTAERRSELASERQAELAKIADLQFETRLNDSFASKAMEVAGESRAALLDRLRGDEATMRRVGGEDGLASLSDDQLRDLAFAKLESEYLDAFGKAGDVIQPGSAGATSDVDRSWASEWLRRAAKAIVQAEMTRARMDTELGPTTASAFDVNEYNNVMSRIKSVILHRSEFAGLPATTVTIRRPDGSTADVSLNHADTVEANSLAAAMLHMSSERRDRFQSNMLGSARGAARDRLTAMFTHARDELASSDSLLTRYTQEEAARSGTSADDPDTQLRARDRLYGERMMELDRIGLAIDRAPEGSRERAELMATWERLMNTALRDGIETYSDMANLDIIVSRMQSTKKPDGSKYSPEELMRLPEFRLGEGGLLSHVTEQQVRSMLNDQVLMIMHHVEAYHHGHESAAKATRSLAKYAERALLALSLLGQFHPDNPGTYKDLFAATRALLRDKDNPQALLRTLGSLGPGRGDPHQSLRWYLNQIETLPGMAGLTAAPSVNGPRVPFSSTAARRDWERRKRAAEANGMLPQVIGVELINTMEDLQATERELTRMRALREYRSSDRAEAARLNALVEELRIRMGWLSGSQYLGPHWRSMQQQLWDAVHRLEELQRAWVAAGRPDDDGWAARIADMEERADGLRDRQGELRSELDRLRPQPAAR